MKTIKDSVIGVVGAILAWVFFTSLLYCLLEAFKPMNEHKPFVKDEYVSVLSPNPSRLQGFTNHERNKLNEIRDRVRAGYQGADRERIILDVEMLIRLTGYKE